LARKKTPALLFEKAGGNLPEIAIKIATDIVQH
jgi:hypothetical protein